MGRIKEKTLIKINLGGEEGMIEKELIINGIKIKANVPDSWIEKVKKE